MTTLTVELHDAAAAFLEQQAAQQGFPSAGEYLAALVERAQAAADRGRIEAELIKGLESGPSRPWSRQDWDSLRECAQRRQQLIRLPFTT